MLRSCLCSQPTAQRWGIQGESARLSPIFQAALTAAHLGQVQVPLFTVLGMNHTEILAWDDHP